MISRRRFLSITGVGVTAASLDARALIVPGAADPAAAATTASVKAATAATARASAVVAPPSTPGRGLFGGLTTLDQTVVKGAAGALGYLEMAVDAGEAHVVRNDLGAWTHPLLSLGAFAQMTDLHVVDDQSPARVEFTDRLADAPNPQNYGTQGAYRPHEMLSTHIVEAMAQAVRNVGAAPITGLPLAFTVVTGDMVDNLQFNELRWVIDLLDGGHTIQADSGQIGSDDSVSGTFILPGIEHHDPAYWSPDGILQIGNLPDNYRGTYGFPTVPGLLFHARQPYTSTGLAMPWYAAMGNHDGTIQGNYPLHPSTLEHEVIPDISDHAPSGEKAWTSSTTLQPSPSNQNVADFTNGLEFIPVPADPNRHFLAQSDFALEHFTTTGLPAGHGFGSDGTTYYAIPFQDSDLVRYITLDTVNYDGNADGRLKQAQYDWLVSELQKNSSFYIAPDLSPVTQSGVQDKLFVIFCHHTLETMNNSTGDIITHDTVNGFTVERLLLSYPNVILLVNGHTHANKISFHQRNFTTSPLGNTVPGPAGGFWEVNTAAHIDWPIQSRILELAAGTVAGFQTISIFTTIIDTVAPATFSGSLTDPVALASLARQLAANDPTERLRAPEDSRTGLATDRNTQLIVPAPFKLPVPLRWGTTIGLALNADGRLEALGADGSDGVFTRFEELAGSDLWGAWGKIDGLLHTVAAGTAGDGRVVLAGVNGGGEVFVRSQQSPGSSALTAWTSLGPVTGRALAAVTDPLGQVNVFAIIGADGNVWSAGQEGETGLWTEWNFQLGLSGTQMVDIAAELNTTGVLEVFTLDDFGNLWHRTLPSSGFWDPWAKLPGVAGVPFAQIASAMNAGGQVQLFVLDNDRRVWTAWQTAAGSGTLSDFVLLDGTGPQSRMTQLAACLNAKGLIELNGVDHAGTVWRRRQTSANAFTGWTGWVTSADIPLRPDVPAPPPGSTIGTPPPTPVVVPTVTGRTVANAEAAILAAGFTIGTVSTVNNCVDPGRVFAQNPAAGSGAPAGSAISFSVASCIGGGK